MPITATDAISGTIYVIATNADRAQACALDYLRDSDDDHNVFDHQQDADAALHNRYRSTDDRDRVYSIRLDIRPTGQ